MRFKRLDLNLLVVLEALLRERSVSRAAQQLNLSQPAVSSALGRLRQYFNDELLVVHGKRMVPTAHALSMEPLVLKALSDIEALIGTSTIFDPHTTQRLFRICATEPIAMVLLQPLLADLESSAPALKIEIVPLSPESLAKLENGEIDFLMTHEQLTSKEHPRHLLFEDNHVVVGWKKNPVFRKPFTGDSLSCCGQIVMTSNHMTGLNDQEAGDMSWRRVEVVCPSFLIVPWLLQNSTRLAVMQQRAAKVLAEKLPLAIAPLPDRLPPIREMVQYHASREADGGVQWLLQRILDCAAPL